MGDTAEQHRASIGSFAGRLLASRWRKNSAAGPKCTVLLLNSLLQKILLEGECSKIRFKLFCTVIPILLDAFLICLAAPTVLQILNNVSLLRNETTSSNIRMQHSNQENLGNLAFFLAVLLKVLLVSGDIETNPGPTPTLRGNPFLFNHCIRILLTLYFTDVHGWDPARLKEFLSSRPISPEVIKALFKEGLTGQQFIAEGGDKQYFKDIFDILELPLKSTDLASLLKTHREITQNPEDVASQTIIQETAEFGITHTDMKYTMGAIIRPETSVSSILEPAREFKMFDLPNKRTSLSDRKFEILEQITKFASGCLNGRLNGTMFLGVGDDRTGQYKHGEVVGLNLTYAEANQINDYIDEFVRNSNKFRSSKFLARDENFSHREAFANCLSPIRIVQIENTERVIVEIDIVPESKVCQKYVFPVHSAYDSREKYWLRSQKDGARTVQIQDIDKFESEESPKIYYWRLEEEQRIRADDPDIQARFLQLFCKGETFINVSIKNIGFVLFSTDLNFRTVDMRMYS